MQKSETQGPEAAGYRCGVVALVGRANVGKSSLLNAVLEEKVSIVSPVAQTTRNRVRAVYSEPQGQLVFLDTPGVHKAVGDLGKIMNRAARSAIEGADVAVLVLDPTQELRDEDTGWMRKLAAADLDLMIVLNKSDLPQPFINACQAAWKEACGDQERPVQWLRLSAFNGEGIKEWREALLALVPEGPALFPEEMLTDFPRRLAIADVIREKYFRVLHDELPHDLAVRVGEIVESDAGWTIYADVLVNRPSQKGMVIGEKGRLQRKVKREAVQDLERIYECPIQLELWVKVEKNWAKNHWILKQLGYSS